MASTAMPLPQIIDGFSYNDQNRHLPSQGAFETFLNNMDPLRRASGFRVREWAVPDNANIPIIGYDTYISEQIQIAAGSFMWGYNFSVISATNPDDSSATPLITDLNLQLVDACTGVPLFQDFANAGVGKTGANAPGHPILLSRPRPILEPGLVVAQIANCTAKNYIVQWRIRFAESCHAINEQMRAAELARTQGSQCR